MADKFERFYKALQWGIRYINANYKGRKAKEKGTHLGKADRQTIYGGMAKMITAEMMGDGVTREEIADYIDAHALLLLEDDD